MEHALHIQDVYEEKQGSVFRGLYRIDQGPQLLRVDVRSGVDPLAADDYIHGRIAGMKALYDNIRSPYPGLLSQEITCDATYTPSYESYTNSKGIHIYQINGFLTDRLVFGACTKEQIAYRGMTLLFVCPARQQLYDMEFIAPLARFSMDTLRGVANDLACR